MSKQDFLQELKSALGGLREEDVQKTLDFYAEMIDDLIEEGASEESAVAQIGSAKEIAKQILMEISISELVKQKIKSKRRMGALEITLLILGSPIWLSLFVAVIAVFVSIYISIWSIVISFWACEVAFWGSAFGGIVSSVALFASGQNIFAGIMIAVGIFLVGFSILFFFVCNALTKGMIWITKRITLGIKSCLLRKEKV